MVHEVLTHSAHEANLTSDMRCCSLGVQVVGLN